jgi:hypothetical protein
MGFHVLNELLWETVAGKKPVNRTLGVDKTGHVGLA